MTVVASIPRTYRLNLLHFYDALTPILNHPKKRLIFLYFITKELSNLGFNIGIMYRYHYEAINKKEIREIEFLIKEDISKLFLGVYANHHVVLRPYSDFIYDITIY